MSDTTVAKGAREKRRGPISGVVRYFRQVIDELRKVVWPTWSELWTYFAVVVVFILVIMLFTGALDAVFDRLVMWVFA